MAFAGLAEQGWARDGACLDHGGEIHQGERVESLQRRANGDVATRDRGSIGRGFTGW